MNETLLEVKDLSVRFFLEEKKQLLPALNRISFHVNENEVLGIIGESGSGKSVTLLSILGLIQANPGIISGEIMLKDGKALKNILADIEQYISIDAFESKDESIEKNIPDWSKVQAARYKSIHGKQISMVFQNPRLAFNPYYSIGKQISESIRLHQPGIRKNDAKEKSIDWLHRVKMEAPEIRYNNNPYGLSGGMCQRAMIAMALASEPKLLIADEPTTGLDATIQGDILNLLEELSRQQAISMILVSHDFHVMRRLANRVLVYYRGFIIEEGKTEDILDHHSDSHHPYTSLLLETEFGEDAQQKSKNSDKDIGISFFSQCPYADKCSIKTEEISSKCHNTLPPLIAVSDSHKVRCWKYDTND